jgi:hypothetical protein
MHGVDLDGQRQSSSSPIIIDPQLKHAAETLSIPLSSRLIYILLTMLLLEEEGLLDDFMAKRLTPGMQAIVAAFQTESNARIVRLATAQETWLEKLCMAFRLYGRGDVGDQAFTMLLRILYGRSHML